MPSPVIVPYRSARPLSRLRTPCGCALPASPGMGDLGMSLFTKFLRISTPGPNPVKLASTPKEVKKVIAVAGPALSAIPGWGTLAAAGAAVITAADQKDKARRLQQTAATNADAASLLQQYGEIAGQIPGRTIGLDTLKQIENAIGATGGWPNVRQWKKQAVDDVINGCKGCTPPTFPDWVRARIAEGKTDPRSLVDEWTAWVNSAWGSKWFVGSAGQLQKQMITDLIDFYVAQFAPNAPQTYGVAAPDQAPVAPSVPSAPSAGGAPTMGNTVMGYAVNAEYAPLYQGSDGRLYFKSGSGWVVYLGPVSPFLPQTPAPVPQPYTPPSAGAPAPSATPPPASVPPDQTAALIKQLMDQGASQQAAFNAALSSLASQGVPPTPQVQQQVASDVAAASKPPMEANTLLLAGGIGAVILLGVMGSRRKGGRARK